MLESHQHSPSSPSLPKADYCILGRTDSRSSSAPVQNHSRPGWTLLSSSPPLPAPGSSHPPPTSRQEQPSLAPPTNASPSPHPPHCDKPQPHSALRPYFLPSGPHVANRHLPLSVQEEPPRHSCWSKLFWELSLPGSLTLCSGFSSVKSLKPLRPQSPSDSFILFLLCLRQDLAMQPKVASETWHRLAQDGSHFCHF